MEPYDDELQRIVAELNRAAPSAPPQFVEPARPVLKAVPATGSNLEQLLTFAAQRNASDVLLIVGAPIALRIDNRDWANWERAMAVEDRAEEVILENGKKSAGIFAWPGEEGEANFTPIGVFRIVSQILRCVGLLLHSSAFQ